MTSTVLVVLFSRLLMVGGGAKGGACYVLNMATLSVKFSLLEREGVLQTGSGCGGVDCLSCHW